MRTWYLGMAAVVVAGAMVLVSGEPEPSAAPSEPASEIDPIHPDPPALMRAVGETLDALMRDDPATVRESVLRIDAGCRRLHLEDDDRYGPEYRNRDQALRSVLTGTRRYAAANDVDEAFTEFVWVLRTCRDCHAMARVKGLLPGSGPLWEAPASNRAESAQSQSERE